jgi:hypothetical protein
VPPTHRVTARRLFVRGSGVGASGTAVVLVQCM